MTGNVATPTMRVQCRSFWLPKGGCDEREYEDAVTPRGEIASSCTVFRAAVADGASATSFSGHWARLLACGYRRGDLHSQNFQEAMPRLQKLWANAIAKKRLDYFCREKASHGAAAALIGLSLQGAIGGGGTWNALAIGDSCCFQIRSGEIQEVFPLSEPEDFSYLPRLLFSLPRFNEEAMNELRQWNGSWQDGDSFYLMSDALAIWFIRQESGIAIETLRQIETRDAFRELVDKERDREDGNRLGNDDTTLIQIQVSTNAPGESASDIAP